VSPLNRGPFTPLDREWVPDHEGLACSACQAVFHLFLRRHHCRWCAKLFCWRCSDETLLGLRSCESCKSAAEM
jgi:hypothetical protein